MSGTSRWGIAPRDSIEAERARRGTAAFVSGCLRVLDGALDDRQLLHSLAGPAVEKYFDGREHEDMYWFRVWALRGLLWVWHESASSAVIAALDDDHWRVREMAAKVAGRHGVDDGLPALARLREDPNMRVRRAAESAQVRLSQA